MKKRFWNSLFFSLCFTFLLFPYIILAIKLAPLNEEEWFVGEKHFVVGFDKGKSEPLISPHSCSDVNDSLYYFSKKRIYDFYIVFSKLPPIVFLCAFGKTFYILGWGHVGPISLIYYKLFESIFKPESIFSIRIPSLIIIILISLFLSYKLKSKYFTFFFLSFPISLFFIPVADIYYSLLYLFSLLSFFSLIEKNFKMFYFWSFLSILTHLRGLIVFVAFVISFVINFRSEFKKIMNVFSLLIPFSLSVYFLPSLADFQSSQEIYTVEVFSAFEIFKFFLLKIIQKIPILFQLVGTRLGDVVVSSNIVLIVKELGLLKSLPFWFLIFSIFISVIFFLPALLDRRNSFYLISFLIYFFLSLFAVPFFGAMPWQFIPLNFLLLIPSFIFYKKEKKIILVPIVLGFVFNLFASLKLGDFVSEHAIWKNHREVLEILSDYGNKITKQKKEILAITKSNIFHLFHDQVEAKYFIQLSEMKKHWIYTEYLSKIISKYEVIILSRYFYYLQGFIPKNYKNVFSNGAFKVFIREE